jgi:hypothetical protein
VDAVQELGRFDPWQESLERSRARRAASNRRRARRRKTRRVGLLVICAGAIFLVAVLASALGNRGTQASATALPTAHGAAVAAHPIHAASDVAGLGSRLVVPAAGQTALGNSCQPTSESSGYVNPLAGAHVKPERIDMGVDYAGTGTLAAIGAGTVTYVGSVGTGWPGTFIEYRLLDGADAGCYVYYAEGVEPAAGLHVGESVAAGQALATIIPFWSTGIELGWAAGTSTITYAEKMHQWSANEDQENIASPAGKSFSALIAALGGPPGKDEG